MRNKSNINRPENGGNLKGYLALAWLLILSGVLYIVIRILELNQPSSAITVQQNFMQVILPFLVVSYGGAVAMFYLTSMRARIKGRRPRGFVLPWIIILLVPLPFTFETILGNGMVVPVYYGVIMLIPFLASVILVNWIDFSFRNQSMKKN